jgi:hypothetical protein
MMRRREAIFKINWLLGYTILSMKAIGRPGYFFKTEILKSTVQRPETYFLQEAVNLGLTAIAHRLDSTQAFRPFFLIQLSPKPYLEHQIWDLGDMCARFTDAFILGRQMTGFTEFKQEEQALRKLLYQSDPYANPFMAGRMLITFVDIYLQEPNLENKKRINKLVSVIRSKMTFEEDYCYYFKQPEGWKTVNDAVFGDFTGYPTFPLGGIVLALARYTETVNDPECEDLLNHMCKFILNKSGTFERDGSYKGHTHSGGILTAAAGIMRWAIRRNDQEIIDQMKNTFDWTLKYSSSWGWVPDGLGPDHASCETCSITDAIHLGLLIARHIDHSYFGIIERFARNQLLENQFRHPEKMLPKTSFPNKNKIEHALNGSWASWSFPGSLDNSLSVEGCCLGSGIRGCFLVWDNIVTNDGSTVWVNMAFSRDSPWLELISHQPYKGKLELKIHNAKTVCVRIPDWVAADKISIHVNDERYPVDLLASNYIKLQRLKPGDSVLIEYPLRMLQTKEIVSGDTYRVRWRGDTVVSVNPSGEIYPLFQREWMEKENATMQLSIPYQMNLGGIVHW